MSFIPIIYISHMDIFRYRQQTDECCGLDLFLFYVTFNSQGHIARGSLWVEEPMHTNWSRFCTVNHRASASNCQLSNMKCPGRDLNQSPQRLKASTLTATSLSPLLNAVEEVTNVCHPVTKFRFLIHISNINVQYNFPKTCH